MTTSAQYEQPVSTEPSAESTPEPAPRGLVFRDAHEWHERDTLVEDLRQDIATIATRANSRDSQERQLLTALITAGALEGALADEGDGSAESSRLQSTAAAVTERIAAAYLGGDPGLLAWLDEELRALYGPGRLRLGRPEGFAYYALHPRDFAEAALSLAGLRRSPVTVVGIRTIGVTLAAVVKAALEREGHNVDRLSVRPGGHPYDRVTEFSEEQLAHIRRRRDVDTRFIVVDEGPGLSGSSFLSVGEALAVAGVPFDRIAFLGSRAFDPRTLVAPDSARRWGRFGSVLAATSQGRHPDGQELSAGQWRALFWSRAANWPASWTAMERRKFLSREGVWLHKFEGLGPYGVACASRAEALANAGLSPPLAGGLDENGYLGQLFVDGAPLIRGDASDEVIQHMGRYVAVRASLFRCDPAQANAPLMDMLRENVAVELGARLPGGLELPCVRPTIVDGRMMPHEWLRSSDGKLLKVDATGHGDDHFFPGPCDVAWDLAGAIIEWDLDEGPREQLLAAYEVASGEDPRDRLPTYELAYAAFRASYCGMAAHGAAADDALRLRGERERYRAALRIRLAS